jgi:hypothetical protein
MEVALANLMTLFLQARRTLLPSGVSSAREASCAMSASSTFREQPSAGMKADGLAISESDRSSLVEQKYIDVTGRLDGPPDVARTLACNILSIPAMPMAKGEHRWW